MKMTGFTRYPERFRTLRTVQNSLEPKRTVLRVLLVLVRTMKTLENVLDGSGRTQKVLQNGSRTSSLEERNDTVSKLTQSIPYYVYGILVTRLEV